MALLHCCSFIFFLGTISVTVIANNLGQQSIWSGSQSIPIVHEASHGQRRRKPVKCRTAPRCPACWQSRAQRRSKICGCPSLLRVHSECSPHSQAKQWNKTTGNRFLLITEILIWLSCANDVAKRAVGDADTSPVWDWPGAPRQGGSGAVLTSAAVPAHPTCLEEETSRRKEDLKQAPPGRGLVLRTFLS